MTKTAGATQATEATEAQLSGERADLLRTLAQHRYFLRFTARELTGEQARQRTTPSALTVGGLIKHVTGTEAGWARFIVDGPSALGSVDVSDAADFAAAIQAHEARFQMTEDESLDGLLAAYDTVAARTDELVRTLPNLDASQPLPVAPWFEPGARWSARRSLLHIIAETAQHAGHADIIREALDGAKTMG